VISGGLGNSLTKAGTGTIILSGLNTYAGTTTITAGTLKLGASGSITLSPVIDVAAGAFFDVSATSFALGSGQTLQGKGTVVGPSGGMTLNGDVAPGGSPGTLAMTGAVTLNGGLDMEIGDINGASSDLLTVSGNLTLGGSSVLNVAMWSGYSLVTGNAYHLVNYGGSLAGTFSGTTGVPGGWTVDYGTVEANYISLVEVPEPGSMGLLLFAFAGACALRRRRERRELA
jgi:fibronectin-binding autotransporter adhesin